MADVVRGIEHIFNDDISGPINFVAPEIITNEDLVTAIGLYAIF